VAHTFNSNTLGGRKRWIPEFRISLVYLGVPGQMNPVSKRKEKKRKEKKRKEKKRKEKKRKEEKRREEKRRREKKRNKQTPLQRSHT
jgi:hypothetical protein